MDAEQAVANAGGNVDLTGSARNDVHLHQLLPEGRETEVGVGNRRGLRGYFLVKVGIALGVQSKLQSFHAVILGEVCHEGSESIGRRGDVEKNLSKCGGLVSSHGVSWGAWARGENFTGRAGVCVNVVEVLKGRRRSRRVLSRAGSQVYQEANHVYLRSRLGIVIMERERTSDCSRPNEAVFKQLGWGGATKGRGEGEFVCRRDKRFEEKSAAGLRACTRLG